jgi:hypothetical protein
MSQLSDLVEAKRAAVEARLQAELKIRQETREQLDREIATAGLWHALGVMRPAYKITSNNELVYRVAPMLDAETYNLKFIVHPSASAFICDDKQLQALYVAEILDVPTVIERLAEYLR